MTIAQTNQDSLLFDLKSSAPTGAEGDIYYNSVDKKLYFYNGTSWVSL